MAIKAVVFLTFLQTVFFAVLQRVDVLNNNGAWTDYSIDEIAQA